MELTVTEYYLGTSVRRALGVYGDQENVDLGLYALSLVITPDGVFSSCSFILLAYRCSIGERTSVFLVQACMCRSLY